MLQLSCAKRCFNSQPPEGGWGFALAVVGFPVSFSSQPPEGGWNKFVSIAQIIKSFQLAAARRRLSMSDHERLRGDAVSTRSRPKAAEPI